MSSTVYYRLELKKTNNILSKKKETNDKFQSKFSNIQLKVSYIIETKLRTNSTIQHKEGPKVTKFELKQRVKSQHSQLVIYCFRFAV